MNRIDEKEAIKLYDDLKGIVLGKTEHEYEKADYAELEGAYEEKGSTTFKNSNGDNITIEIHHYHKKDSWCTNGLSYIPDFQARIFKNDNCIWELEGHTIWVSRSPYDDDLVLECSKSFKDLPRELLKPFKKKRPEKATNKVYIEEPVRDNRTLIDEITKAYTNYCNAIKKKNNVLKEKEEKVKQAIEAIAKEYSDSINERTKEEEDTKTQFINYKDLVSTYSSFDVDLIGKAIARIISAASGKKFKYGNVTSHYEVIEFDMLSDPYTERKTERDCIVVETSKYEQDYHTQHGENPIDELVEDGHAILLIRNYDASPDKYRIVTFLTTDESGGLKFINVNLDDFDYIKDFIIEVAQYRFQRELDKFTEGDMNLCIDRFIPKAEQIHIKNRIDVLQEELKTLNLKLKK